MLTDELPSMGAEDSAYMLREAGLLRLARQRAGDRRLHPAQSALRFQRRDSGARHCLLDGLVQRALPAA